MYIIGRHIAAQYFKAFLGTLLGLVVIWLVVDYVDLSKQYTGEGWQRAVLELYLCKAVGVAYELMPASLLLAAGITLAGIYRRGEYTALRALAFGPAWILLPIAITCAIIVGLTVVADTVVVGKASRRVDEIRAGRFKHYGGWNRYFGEVRWFSGKRHIYHLREGSADNGFSQVTIYTLSESFRLARRIDAARMVFVKGTTWRMLDGTQRSFSQGQSKEERFAQRDYELDENPSAFRIVKGRPEQLDLAALRQQIVVRRNVGLPVERWLFVLHNKFAYPLSGMPGTLLACALTLRRGRRSYLTSAIAEGFAIIIASWALLVVFKAAALAGLVTPVMAAWCPAILLGLIAAGGVWKLSRT